MSEKNTDYFALASDGDGLQTDDREEAFEWIEEHLAMLESLEPNNDHWVQLNFYGEND